MAMRYGVFVPQGWRMDLVDIKDPVAQYEAMTNVAHTADALEIFDSIWLYDHFHTVPTPTANSVFECWTTTAALTRDTKRVKVGQMVTCNGYRNPSLLAKMASTVDVMSHGRLYCGLGAGWYEHEWLAYGYGFPETRERMRAFREAVEIVSKMWTEDQPTFKGEYYSITAPYNEPKTARQPHPSLWSGGGGEQVTLKLVAKYGDACNVGGDTATIKHKLEVLRGHCEKIGRPYEEITRSTQLGNLFIVHEGEDARALIEPGAKTQGLTYEEFVPRAQIGTPQQIAEKIREMADVGIDYIITYFPRAAYDHEQLYRFANEVAPLVSDL